MEGEEPLCDELTRAEEDDTMAAACFNNIKCSACSNELLQMWIGVDVVYK